MSIKEMEDELFKSWRESYPNETFVEDGAPCPEEFENSSIKCLFILKDPNFDPNEVQTDTFEMRTQLADKPHDWWRTVATWCAGISRIDENPTWDDLKNEDFKQALKPFAFMQLKKIVGVGSVNDTVLWDFANRDRSNIIKQIQIYQPRVIICGGVGKFIANVFEVSDWKTTKRGVQYMILNLDGLQTVLIDYMHPSARAAKNVVCFGILDAYREITNGLDFTQQTT